MPRTRFDFGKAVAELCHCGRRKNHFFATCLMQDD
jgi:hypothetical protein